MADELMYIPNDDTQSSPFYRLQLVVKTLDNQLNEVVQPTNRKTLLRNFQLKINFAKLVIKTNKILS